MNLGKVFKKFREEKGITQRSLAQALNITPTALYKIESGKNWPKQKTIEAFKMISGYPTARIYIEALGPEDYASRPCGQEKTQTASATFRDISPAK